MASLLHWYHEGKRYECDDNYLMCAFHFPVPCLTYISIYDLHIQKNDTDIQDKTKKCVLLLSQLDFDMFERRMYFKEVS